MATLSEIKSGSVVYICDYANNFCNAWEIKRGVVDEIDEDRKGFTVKIDGVREIKWIIVNLDDFSHGEQTDIHVRTRRKDIAVHVGLSKKALAEAMLKVEEYEKNSAELALLEARNRYESIEKILKEVEKEEGQEEDKPVAVGETSIDRAINFFSEQGFGASPYEEDDNVCGVELEDWTNGGVEMPVFLDGRDEDLSTDEWWLEAFVRYVDNFDVDEEIELHRQGDDYRRVFSFSQSLSDFEEWKERIEDVESECISRLRELREKQD